MNNINYAVKGKPYIFKNPPPYKLLASQTVNVWDWWFVFIKPLIGIFIFILENKYETSYRVTNNY